MSFSKPIPGCEPTDVSTESPVQFPDLEHTMSIFIPYAKLSVTREQVAVAFYRNEIGVVKRVDMIRKEEDDRTFYQLFVHFEHWFESYASINIRNKLHSGEQARMVYDDPCYWNIFANHSWQRDVYQDTTDEITRLRNLITTMQDEQTRALKNAEKVLEYNEKVITSQFEEIENLVKTTYTRVYTESSAADINELTEHQCSMIRTRIQQECTPETDTSMADLCTGVESYKIDDDTAQVCPATPPPSTYEVPTTPPPAPKRARRLQFTQDVCDNA